MKNMFSRIMVLLIMSVILLLNVQPALSAELDSMTHELINEWRQERDRNVKEYLAKFMNGNPYYIPDMVRLLAKIIDKDTSIVSACGRDTDCLSKNSLLYGMGKFNQDSLPIKLIRKLLKQHYSVNALFAKTTFKILK